MSVECYICHNLIDENHAEKIFGGNCVCEECYNEQPWYHCEACGALVDENNFEDIECDSNEELCPICFNEQYGYFNHYYKPVPVFDEQNNRENILHIGAELELEGKERSYFNKDVNKFCGKDFILKLDGSLDDDDGIEIVSRPMTINSAIQNWKNLFNLINKWNMQSFKNCGLHFHLDRKYLKTREIRNIDYVINNFIKTVEKIGGRDIKYNDWACCINKSIENWGKYSDESRYVAVNMRNKNTVELRCFNSTDDYRRFLDILIAVYALVECCRKHTFEYFYCQNDDRFYEFFMKYIQRFKQKHKIIA